jgi:hypothetical protein
MLVIIGEVFGMHHQLGGSTEDDMNKMNTSLLKESTLPSNMYYNMSYQTFMSVEKGVLQQWVSLIWLQPSQIIGLHPPPVFVETWTNQFLRE